MVQVQHDGKARIQQFQSSYFMFIYGALFGVVEQNRLKHCEDKYRGGNHNKIEHDAQQHPSHGVRVLGETRSRQAAVVPVDRRLLQTTKPLDDKNARHEHGREWNETVPYQHQRAVVVVPEGSGSFRCVPTIVIYGRLRVTVRDFHFCPVFPPGPEYVQVKCYLNQCDG